MHVPAGSEGALCPGGIQHDYGSGPLGAAFPPAGRGQSVLHRRRLSCPGRTGLLCGLWQFPGCGPLGHGALPGPERRRRPFWRIWISTVWRLCASSCPSFPPGGRTSTRCGSIERPRSYEWTGVFSLLCSGPADPSGAGSHLRPDRPAGGDAPLCPAGGIRHGCLPGSRYPLPSGGGPHGRHQSRLRHPFPGTQRGAAGKRKAFLSAPTALWIWIDACGTAAHPHEGVLHHIAAESQKSAGDEKSPALFFIFQHS